MSKYSAIVFTNPVDIQLKEKPENIVVKKSDETPEDDYEDFEDDFEPYETSNENDETDKSNKANVPPPRVVAASPPKTNVKKTNEIIYDD